MDKLKICEKIDQLSTDIDYLHQFTHGPEDETVPLGGVETPTLRHFLADAAKLEVKETEKALAKAQTYLQQYVDTAKQYAELAAAGGGGGGGEGSAPVPIATILIPGIVKPDNKTIGIEPDGTIKVIGGISSGGVTLEQVAQAINTKGNPVSEALKTAVSDEAGTIKETITQEIKKVVNVEIVGGGDPVCGIARIRKGGQSGIWARVDKDLEPVNLTQYYFDTHPVYYGIETHIIDNQVMVKIPKFYVKHIKNASVLGSTDVKVTLISPTKEDGFHVHPAFMHHEEEIPCFWIGAYKAYQQTESNIVKMCSVPGVIPTTSINFSQAKDRCAARNTGGVEGFMLYSFYQRAAIQLLMLLEFGNPDMQNILGRGWVDSSASDGRILVNDTRNHKPWRGIHGLYGNTWDWCDGIHADANRKLQIWDNKGNQQYVDTNINMVTTRNWIVDMFDNTDRQFDMSDVFLPSEVNATEANGTYGDYYWEAVANGYCIVGGGWNYGSQAGLFTSFFFNVASHSNVAIGARLAKV